LLVSRCYLFVGCGLRLDQSRLGCQQQLFEVKCRRGGVCYHWKLRWVGGGRTGARKGSVREGKERQNASQDPKGVCRVSSHLCPALGRFRGLGCSTTVRLVLIPQGPVLSICFFPTKAFQTHHPSALPAAWRAPSRASSP
jgi:hypothetical protein